METFFNLTGSLANYLIGLEKQGTSYMWADGGAAGSGLTSNTNPYAHFSYDFSGTLATSPTYTAVIASAAYKYVSFKGSSSSADQKNASLYSGIGAYGYQPRSPTSSSYYMCEVRRGQPERRMAVQLRLRHLNLYL